jgi:hypothetical protein
MPSTVVKYYNYDLEKETLTIGYVSGMVYQYLKVPQAVYNSL